MSPGLPRERQRQSHGACTWLISYNRPDPPDRELPGGGCGRGTIVPGWARRLGFTATVDVTRWTLQRAQGFRRVRAIFYNHSNSVQL